MVAVVELNPVAVFERGWGNATASPAVNAVAVVRGPLVFALHPSENRTVVRNFSTVGAGASSFSSAFS